MYCVYIPDKEITTEGILLSLGVSYKLSGFRYAEYMIEKAVEDPDCLLLITKILYPEVAEKFNVSPNAVENSLRKLINVCWNKPDHYMLNEIAGRELKKPPSNLEFLHMLSAYIKQFK